MRNHSHAKRGTESSSLWGTSSPHPQCLQLLLTQHPLVTFPAERAELICTLMGGTDAKWDSHSNGASPSHRRLQCRKDKSEDGPWLLQPLPHPAPHRTVVTARSHPSGHDAAVCRYPDSQKPFHEQLAAGQQPKAKPFPSSLRRLLCRGGAAEPHSAQGSRAEPDVLGYRAKGVLEMRNTAI